VEQARASNAVQDVARSACVGGAALVPAAWLARDQTTAGLATGAIVVLSASLLRWCAYRWAPELARGYVFSRLCSLRFSVPVVALPLVSAWAVSRGGRYALAAAFAVHVVLAHRYRARWRRSGALPIALATAVLGGLYCALQWLSLRGREWQYAGRLLYAEESPLQRVVLVERGGSLELFIEGELQFRSFDERLYHDGLLEPALGMLRGPSRVLVMGGGDGLAARDLLRSARVERITIVDWDRAVTRLFRTDPSLRALNDGALFDARVEVVHRDVRRVLCEPGAPFDLVVGDLTDPDPSDAQATALCSSAFYRAIRARLAPHGVLVTHASSLDGAWAARAIPQALAEAGFVATSYVRDVPSFDRVSYVIGVLTPKT
jgi:spermidine synthase